MLPTAESRTGLAEKPVSRGAVLFATPLGTVSAPSPEETAFRCAAGAVALLDPVLRLACGGATHDANAFD